MSGMQALTSPALANIHVEMERRFEPAFVRRVAGVARRPAVLLADSHRIVAEGVARLIEHAFDVVSVVDDGDALFDAARSLDVELVVADVAMPRRSGLRTLKDLRAVACHVPFVFLTMHAEPAIVATAMRSGANGYVLKSNSGADLLTALEAALSGSIHMPSSLAARQLGSLSRPLGITDRQHSVLKLIAEGRVTKEIARELGLSTRTVEAHRYSMMQTLRVHSAMELVRTAAALGLLAVADVGMGDL